MDLWTFGVFGVSVADVTPKPLTDAEIHDLKKLVKRLRFLITGDAVYNTATIREATNVIEQLSLHPLLIQCFECGTVFPMHAACPKCNPDLAQQSTLTPREKAVETIKDIINGIYNEVGLCTSCQDGLSSSHNVSFTYSNAIKARKALATLGWISP